LLRYAGVGVARTLCVTTAVLYMMRCRTGSQWSDHRRGLASDWPSHWQATLTKLFCAHCSLLSVSTGAP